MTKVTQTLLEDGYWLHTSENEDGSTYSFKFVKYWHPYESVSYTHLTLPTSDLV